MCKGRFHNVMRMRDGVDAKETDGDGDGVGAKETDEDGDGDGDGTFVNTSATLAPVLAETSIAWAPCFDANA